MCHKYKSKRTITYIIHTTRTKEGRKRKERTTDCVISTVLPKEKKTEEDYSSDSIGTLTTDRRKTKSGESYQHRPTDNQGERETETTR